VTIEVNLLSFGKLNERGRPFPFAGKCHVCLCIKGFMNFIAEEEREREREEQAVVKPSFGK